MSTIIDDYKDVFGVWRKSLRIDGVQTATRSGVTWGLMNNRCLHGGAEQARRPMYVGCTTSPKFKDFNFFAEWSTNQVGYNVGFALDKDILYKENKVYSEDACVFVPQALNSFLNKSCASRGAYPIGVCLHKESGKFVAYAGNSGTASRYLGIFNTEADAYAEYKGAKEAEARRWHERLRAGEYIVDPRVIERMRTWTLPA